MHRRRIIVFGLLLGAILVIVAAILYAQMAVPEHPSAAHDTQTVGRKNGDIE